MKDIIVRLASMKLAELKFHTRLIRVYGARIRTPLNTPLSLKQIRDLIKIARASSDPILIGEYAYGYTTSFRITSQMESTIIAISKPEEMNEEVFYKIIKTLEVPLKKY